MTEVRVVFRLIAKIKGKRGYQKNDKGQAKREKKKMF